MNGFNQAIVVGHVGNPPRVTSLQSGRRVANFSVATNEGYRDSQGTWIDKVEWHNIVTFQDGLITMLENHAEKGRAVCVTGKLQTRKYFDKNNVEHRATEILVGPGGTVNFLSKKREQMGATTQQGTTQPQPTAENGGQPMPATNGAGPAPQPQHAEEVWPF